MDLGPKYSGSVGGWSLDDLQRNHDDIQGRLEALREQKKIWQAQQDAKSKIEPERAPGDSLKDPVAIANAALVDLGMKPSVSSVRMDGEVNYQVVLAITDSMNVDEQRKIYRAGALGAMGAYGKDVMIFCFDCAKKTKPGPTWKSGCITAEEALMGRTCGQ